MIILTFTCDTVAQAYEILSQTKPTELVPHVRVAEKMRAHSDAKRAKADAAVAAEVAAVEAQFQKAKRHRRTKIEMEAVKKADAAALPPQTEGVDPAPVAVVHASKTPPTSEQLTEAQALIQRVFNEKSFETALALLSRQGVERLSNIASKEAMDVFITDAKALFDGSYDPTKAQAA